MLTEMGVVWGKFGKNAKDALERVKLGAVAGNP